MFIEEEFIKTIMPFENPTTSEINGWAYIFDGDMYCWQLIKGVYSYMK
jgi:hypothetical protein